MKKSEVILRLVLSVLIGGLIGYEREYQKRPAGFITHILVCIGSTIISIIQICLVQNSIDIIMQYPQLSNVIKVDSGRIISQIVSGIGFLGAGTIIHHKGSVKGLTTAATLWVVACMGISVGLGYYFLSIVSTIVVYFVLIVLKKVKVKIQDKNIF